MQRNLPEKHKADRQAGLWFWMATQPPTARQLRYLKKLGYRGVKPGTRLDAFEIIHMLLKARGRA